MPKYCSNCGTSFTEGAKFCNSCGAPAGNIQQAYARSQGYPAAAAPAAQRMESTVIQVSPDYENDKIQEMEMFGWTLQGRQEIHEEGDAYGRPSTNLLSSPTYVITTKVSHYVKLHFVRNIALPHLTETKKLEAEYFNLPFQNVPGMGWPVGFLVFGIIAVVLSLVTEPPAGAPPFIGVIVPVIWVGLSLLWVRSRTKKRAAALANNRACIARMEEIRAQVSTLLAA